LAAQAAKTEEEMGAAQAELLPAESGVTMKQAHTWD
jgi:hypothetical protein